MTPLSFKLRGDLDKAGKKARPTTVSPSWWPDYLRRHHTKRITTDAGCFESLLGISGRPMTLEEYETRAHTALREAQFVWEADAVKGYNRLVPQHYYADGKAVLCVLSQTRHRFVTCFHKHFRKPHGIDPRPTDTPGQIGLKLSRWIEHQEDTGRIRNPRNMHGFV